MKNKKLMVACGLIALLAFFCVVGCENHIPMANETFVGDVFVDPIVESGEDFVIVTFPMIELGRKFFELDNNNARLTIEKVDKDRVQVTIQNFQPTLILSGSFIINMYKKNDVGNEIKYQTSKVTFGSVGNNAWRENRTLENWTKAEVVDIIITRNLISKSFPGPYFITPTNS